MIHIITFGFKYGPPPCNFIFDVTFLPNPARADNRRLDSELSEEMVEEVSSHDGFATLISTSAALLQFLDVTGMEIRLGIGCNGGKHRSRVVATALALELERQNISCSIEHRD